MTQREQIALVCEELVIGKDAVFLGYNVKFGSQMYGTLKRIPLHKLVETPCAENLMAGMGVGLALQGKHLPVVCFERHEFAIFGLGQLAVMADKLHAVSGVRVPMVVRVIKGAEGPLDPGEQHKGNYGAALMQAMPNSVFLFAKFGLTYDQVASALKSSKSGVVVILEERDGYDTEANGK